MIAEEIQAASQYMLIAFLFPILGLSLSLGIYFLFFWEDHHIQPLGHFSEKMKRKTAGAQHQAWTTDVQCSSFYHSYHFLLLAFGIYFLFVWGYFSGKAGAQRRAWTRDVQYLTFLSFVYKFLLSIGSFLGNQKPTQNQLWIWM